MYQVTVQHIDLSWNTIEPSLAILIYKSYLIHLIMRADVKKFVVFTSFSIYNPQITTN